MSGEYLKEGHWDRKENGHVKVGEKGYKAIDAAVL